MGICVETNARAAHVVIDRPPLNVLNIELLKELDSVLANFEVDPTVDLIVLRGAGVKAFSAGVDIQDHTPEKVPGMLETVHGMMKRLLGLPQITIAGVHGLCLGGGCELASCCDLVVATKDSVFATPEVNVGCYPPLALARFGELIGYHRAVEMILTGRRYSAADAVQIGLINRVVPSGQLDEGLHALTNELLDKSGAVLRIALKGLRARSLAGFAEALRQSEALYCNDLLSTRDVAEGVDAFLQKRKPNWSHT